MNPDKPELLMMVLAFSLTACSAQPPAEPTAPSVSAPTPTIAPTSTFALTPTPTTPCSPSSTAMNYLALGDSYTIGESVSATERWPMQLAGLLRAQQVNIGDPLIIARTGWTTDELDSAITDRNPPGPYDLVSLLIGVNNQYRGRRASEYREQFTALLDRAIGFAGDRAGRVLVLSIPDWGVTPFATGQDRKRIGAEIDAFNTIAQEQTELAGAHFVDITPISRRAATESGWVADDGLHPSGKMYAEWAQLALPVVCEMLK